MKLEFLEKWIFKLTGRSIPCVKIEDIDAEGKIRTIRFVGNMKLKANTITNTWETTGVEIDREAGMITIIDRSGISALGYVISEQGTTRALYTTPRDLPDAEEIFGPLTMMDIIGDSMNLNKSIRNIAIGIVIGIIIGWIFVGPMISTIFK